MIATIAESSNPVSWHLVVSRVQSWRFLVTLVMWLAVGFGVGLMVRSGTGGIQPTFAGHVLTYLFAGLGCSYAIPIAILPRTKNIQEYLAERSKYNHWVFSLLQAGYYSAGFVLGW